MSTLALVAWHFLQKSGLGSTSKLPSLYEMERVLCFSVWLTVGHVLRLFKVEVSAVLECSSCYFIVLIMGREISIHASTVNQNLQY